MDKAVKKIQKLFNEKKYREVIKKIEANKKAKKSIKTLSILGASYHNLGQHSEAVAVYETALTLDPNSLSILNNLALVLQHGNLADLKRSKEILIEITKKKPGDTRFFVNLLRAHILLNEDKEAQSLYQNLSSSNKNEITTPIMCCDLYVGLKKQELAKYYCLKALNIAPQNIKILNKLAKIQYDNQEYDAAARSFQKVIQGKPTYYPAVLNLANCLKHLGQVNNAKKLISFIIKEQPENYEAYNTLGVIFHKEGDDLQAIQSYKKAIEHKTDYVAALNNLAVSYINTDQFDLAMDCLRNSIKSASDAEKQSILVNILETLDKYNKIDDLEEWIESASIILGEIPADVLVHKARYELRTKNYIKAKETLSQISIFDLQKVLLSTYYSTLGKVNEKLGVFDEAWSAFQKLNQLAETSSEYKRYDVKGYLASLRKKDIFISNMHSKGECKENDGKIFMIGFPRSGTTLLDVMLRSHDKIQVIEEKPLLERTLGKIKYEELLDANISQNELEKLRDRYNEIERSYISDKAVKPVIVNKLPLNILRIGEIETLFPKSKYIVSLRHPFDSILSNFMQDYKLNQSMACMTNLKNIVELYDASMRLYQRAKQIWDIDDLVIKYEDLTVQHEKTLQRIMAFLEIEWSDSVLDYRETAVSSKRIFTPSYSQVVEPIYKSSMFKWKNYQHHLNKHNNVIGKWIDKYSY